VKTNFKMKLGLNASRPEEKLPHIKSKQMPELDKNFLQKCSTGIKRNRGQWVWDCQYIMMRDVAGGSISRIFPVMLSYVGGVSIPGPLLVKLPRRIGNVSPSGNLLVGLYPSSSSYCFLKQSPTGKKSQHLCWYISQTYVSWPVYSVSGLLMRCMRKKR